MAFAVPGVQYETVEQQEFTSDERCFCAWLPARSSCVHRVECAAGTDVLDMCMRLFGDDSVEVLTSPCGNHTLFFSTRGMDVNRCVQRLRWDFCLLGDVVVWPMPEGGMGGLRRLFPRNAAEDPATIYAGLKGLCLRAQEKRKGMSDGAAKRRVVSRRLAASPARAPDDP